MNSIVVMRIRVFICLLAMVVAYSAMAGSIWFQLHSSNISKQPLAFNIATEKTPQGGVLFYVHIESKKEVLSATRWAGLTVSKGKEQIVHLTLNEVKQGKGVSFVFEVSQKYLAQSKFAFRNYVERESPWGGEVYWFLLKDFAKAEVTKESGR